MLTESILLDYKFFMKLVYKEQQILIEQALMNCKKLHKHFKDGATNFCINIISPAPKFDIIFYGTCLKNAQIMKLYVCLM